MFRVMRIVFLKEARDLLRDLRTLFFLFAPPILLPLMGAAGLVFLGWQITRQTPGGMPVAVEGGGLAPALIETLDESSLLNLIDPPIDTAAALREGELMVLLTIPPDAPQRIEAELPFTVTVTTSRAGWIPALASTLVKAEVMNYSRTLLEERMAGRGLAMRWLQPLRIVDAGAPTADEIVNPMSGASDEPMTRSLNGILIPLMVASWSMGGGLHLIVHMTVGEKEKNTMEALLTTVASRTGIVLGKIGLSMVVSIITVAMWAVLGLSYLLAINLMPTLGSLRPSTLATQTQSFGIAGIWLLALMIPLMTMTSSLIAAVCTFARNNREASMFTSLIQMGLPLLSFLAVFLAPTLPSPLIYAIPFFGVLVAVRDLFLSGLAPAMLALTGLASLAYAVLSVLLAVYVFSREWALMRGL